MKTYDFCSIFLNSLKEEAEALLHYSGDLSDLNDIIHLILELKGKLVLMGVGKSGLVAQKISATFSSTGTPSFFLHPTEAMHGDLGALSIDDCVLAVSYSGESLELSQILPHVRRMGIQIITFSKSKHSKISQLGDYFIPLVIEKEACPIGTAPTTSTTLTLALGDALAICLMKAREFTRNDFALFHPGGSLGRELFVKVRDIMQIDNIPILDISMNLREAIVVMSEGRLGNAFFVDSGNRLLGILSDGDLRRAMCDKSFSLEAKAFQYATESPRIIHDREMLAFEALRIMKDLKIQIIPIVRENGVLEGVIHLHTLIQAGF
ncbi:KpsF/GutQ family sugar-phosphate isomerase [Helicobacter didelphidarum]|uniref:KpsF/GutQ family sugar-phosphate isomerase n=1 Tax=Helicobacter didelphidarum TaxID=2040648 RepID=A0A3D8IEQ1_9HELI|nr:KpsF/GutQ family sugar-phosphate isomerase [Helicobacter didelphidarum]RDU63588.1 KpsF/GutQ family sugar-phosphate isomerase [Helicobacter didelphidarum]